MGDGGGMSAMFGLIPGMFGGKGKGGGGFGEGEPMPAPGGTPGGAPQMPVGGMGLKERPGYAGRPLHLFGNMSDAELAEYSAKNGIRKPQPGGA